jgi:hypothetical protein
MALICVKIGNTYINIMKITHFTFYQAKESRPIEFPKQRVSAADQSEEQPAMLNINLVGGEKLEFSGPKAEKGFDKLTELMAGPMSTVQ